MSDFEKVKDFILDMGFAISHEEPRKNWWLSMMMTEASKIS